MLHDASPAPPPAPTPTPAPLAPWPHTVALLLLLAAIASVTHHRSTLLQAGRAPVPHVREYIVSIVAECVLLAVVVAGISNRRAFFLRAFCDRAHTWWQMLGAGAMTYACGMLAVGTVGALLYLTPLGRQRNEAVVLALLPRTPLELALWFGVSLSAGVCEELVFRGYLQRQLWAWWKRPGLAIALASLLFGAVHVYEGAAAVLPLAALACVYGVVARRYDGDLRAVMVAHTLQDFVVALLVLARPWVEAHAQRT